MGRRPSPTTKVVLALMDARILADEIEVEVPLPLRPKVWALKAKINYANGVLEFPDRRST